MQKNSPDQNVYINIVENSPDFIMRYDREFRFLYMNLAGFRISGKTKKHIIGKTLRESGIYNTTQCDFWEQEINRVFETGNTYQQKLEWQIAMELLWINWRLSPEYDDTGNIISVLSVSRDITKEIQAEKSLAESEESLRLFNEHDDTAVNGMNRNFNRANYITDNVTEHQKAVETLRENEEIFSHFMEHSPIYVFFKDSEIRSLRLSKNYEKMLGRPLEELLGKSNDDLFPSALAKKMVEDDKRILRKGKLEVIEEEFNGRYYTTLKFPIIIDGVPKYLSGYTIDITDHKNADKALKESEEKFRSIADNLSDVIFIIDAEGVINYISASYGTFGYTPEECAGRFFGDLLEVGEEDKAMLVFKDALNSIRKNNSVTLSFKRKDGSGFYGELTCSVFKVGIDNQGVLGLIRDCSDRMNREIELRKLSRAVEQNPASIVITNTEGLIEYTNPKLSEITGYSKKELIGKNPEIWSSHEKSKAEYKKFWNMIKSGKDWKGEFHNRKKNGELYWESAIVSSIKNENNEITHFLGIKEDITLRKTLEEKTIASEQRYRELFLDNPIPSYIFDEGTLEFIEVNEATVITYGYSRGEFLSMTLKDIRLPEDIPDLLEAINKLGKDAYHSSYMRHRRKDGTIFPVEITSHSLPEKNDRKTRLVMAINISERVKAAEQMILAREKAEASDRLKTTFLNNISHEVRTPLNGILGFADIISQSDLSEKEKQDSIIMLFESSDRLLHTITNYMDISLLTSGSMSSISKTFFPVQILRKIFDNFELACSKKKLVLFLDIPKQSDNLAVSSDQEIIQKVMSHFLDNAVKFTERGSIHFGFKYGENQLEFFVKDTGIGIEKDSLTEMFDMFRKEDRGPYRLFEGSGLGLSIAKGMIGIIGGSILAESVPGVGSTFGFSIPFPGSHLGSGYNTIEIERKVVTERSAILVAEDDETNFFYLNAILKRETDIKVLHASNGREAIELFKANPDIILVLMDMKMPVIDGFEATRQIKLIKQDVPVIAVTAYAMSGDEERVLAAGCDGYLSKPINQKDLLKKIAEFRT